MQALEEEQVTQEIASLFEYQVIQSAIEELTKVLVTIQNNLTEEIHRTRIINRLMDSQLEIMENIASMQTVSLENVRTIREDYYACVKAMGTCGETVKNLNDYLGDRIRQMKKLQKKRRDIIAKNSPAQIYEFKVSDGKTEDC